jgi:hypothetical protein
MNTSKTPQEINRRHFLGTAAMTIAAAQCGIFRSAEAQSQNAELANVPPIKPGTNTSFALLKQIDAGLLITVPTITLEGDANPCNR